MTYYDSWYLKAIRLAVEVLGGDEVRATEVVQPLLNEVVGHVAGGGILYQKQVFDHP